MDPAFDPIRLMALRGLTTALAQHFEADARAQIANIAPLLKPAALLGDFIRYEKAQAREQDAALREIVRLYVPIAKSPAIGTQPELKPPLDIYATTIDLVPASYPYTPEGGSKPVTIETPLKWVVAYKDNGLARLRELRASHARSGGTDLQGCVLHYLALHMLLARRPGPAAAMEALRYTLTSTPAPEHGGLPVVHLAAPLPTLRPSDAVILQSTMISGATTFAEVVDVDAIGRMRDPVKEGVMALVRAQGGGISAEIGDDAGR